MVSFTGISKVLARESVVLQCFKSLLISFEESKLQSLFDSVERLDYHSFYLNDDDEKLPRLSVRRRLRTFYIKEVLYEGELGVRQPETDDFDPSIVAQVVGKLKLDGYFAVLDKMHLESEDAERRKKYLATLMAEFVESFDPSLSPRFRKQPKPNRQKFWLTPPDGVDPLAFRHD